MSQSIDILSRAVGTTPEVSILPHSLVEGVGVVSTQLGIVALIGAVCGVLALSGKVAQFAPYGTKRLAGGLAFMTLAGILLIAVYAVVQLQGLATQMLV